MNIGKGIKFVRVASDLKQGEMATKLEISQNYLSLLENNKAEPSVALLKKISSVFGVPAGFLFWEDAMPEDGSSPEITQRMHKIRSLVHELQQMRITRQIQQTT